MDGHFTKPESFLHYTTLSAGSQLEQGEGNPLRISGQWHHVMDATSGPINWHSLLNVSLHHYFPEYQTEWSFPDPWALSH